MALKKWVVASIDRRAARQLSQQTGIPAVTAALLQSRGCSTPQQAADQINGAPLSDPLRLKDMDRAVQRIQKAIDSFEKVTVYGDYDADGVTATAILYSYLESSGANVSFYIPDREKEGYGLNMAAVDKLHERQVDLLITVDNGISSLPEVEHARELGIDVVITDHHRSRPELPQAQAVVDPFRPDDTSEDKCLCGAGLAFKLVQALEGEDSDQQLLLETYADLLTIGTVGDVVPLTGENRTFLRTGLRLLPQTDRPGLRALLEKAGLEDRELTAENIAFGIVPRINACGRIGSPDRAVRLLLSEDPDEACLLAADICDDNDYRKQLEAEIYESALQQLQQEPDRLLDRVLVVEGRGWHTGVIGIVASRLTETFGKPSIVLSCGNHEAKGSGRSVEGFSLFQAISACADLLTKFGGHAMAAGMTMPAENTAEFRRRINAYAASQGTMPVPVLQLDGVLKPARISLELPHAADLLQPFGTGNPKPLYGLFGVRLQEIQPVGGGKHLRLVCSAGGVRLRCMKFGMELSAFPYHPGDMLDLAVELIGDVYNGRETLSIIVRDMKLSGCDEEALLKGRELFEKAKRGDPLTTEEFDSLSPDRAACAGLYRTLRACGGYRGGAEGVSALGKMPFARLLVCLELFQEHGLVEAQAFGTQYTVTMCTVKGKVDLSDSGFLRGLRAQVQMVPQT
ncbi:MULTISPECIES: single-stranded-DNA-specific exonuclease RecJ [Caproicibacterium]|uniref:single-stranded-DNA-specific exonuclease RecJ n=1 Tax=Caproicibacterium TaxID=2834348 RepID=UPI000A28DAC0|nr:single-stranded-DNA-specific exonuclease RecJ [Caproicibacterium lactatifermentans]ARP50721.1 single-stranded-DNA-specific exonuclease RecJ [Ruminococcaceae bacterium CPB6]MDD4807045.1 single-stranded-DNA-specific exonuclease RecJ [Oscillospiraceae bacterium]